MTESKKFKPRIRKKAMPESKATTPKTTNNEGTKRLTLDLRASVYLELKIYALKNGLTVKKYIETLVVKDLGL